MIEFYPQIKLVHVSAVLASGALFAVRGLARQLGAAWPLFAPVRYLSYTIDTVLLTAAFMLMTVLHQYPFAQPWLTVKVILVVVYIGLGAFAISYGSTPRMPMAMLPRGDRDFRHHRFYCTTSSSTRLLEPVELRNEIQPDRRAYSRDGCEMTGGR